MYYSERVELRLTRADREALDYVCQRLQRSRSDAIRFLIRRAEERAKAYDVWQLELPFSEEMP